MGILQSTDRETDALTRHKAAEGHCSLPNEVSANRIVVPNKKANQSYFGHMDSEAESFFPNRIETCEEQTIQYVKAM